ncbi:MAG TPA: AMP-binding protein [Spirochaetales bacterium]|nr:AMP-binding protein [Spirochaetales bacterium]HRZ64888.1 AMP-binding protein [Spirochaetia bacterium]
MNTSDYLLEDADGGRTALIEASGARTYGELRAAAARMAGELRSLGLAPGARVGLLGANSLFWAASYLAIMKLGCVAVPFSSMLKPEEMAKNAAWAGCEAVCMDRRMRRPFGSAFPPALRVVSDEALELPGPAEWPSPSLSPDTGDAALMFTSGTTAKPKAVRITHDNIQANTDSIIEYLGLRADDCMLVILPFFYCFGTSLLHTHLRVGGALALCNSFTFPETALDMMEKQGCTGFAGVPSSFQLLLRISTFRARALPKLRLIQQAGGNLHQVLLKELIAAKPAARVFVMYGQTEATARLSYLPPEKLADKLGSIGRGVPGTELRVLGEDGRPVAPGQVGEIVARGRNISPGYYNDPEASAEKFPGGSLRTGDLATVDEEGYIFVVDRKDDFIKSWGYRVSSQEIESCALGLPEVVSAAAVGVPDLQAGEAIHLFVVLRPGAPLAAEDIASHCRGGLAKHMVPCKVTIVERMPLNANGKIVKTELRRMAAK